MLCSHGIRSLSYINVTTGKRYKTLFPISTGWRRPVHGHPNGTQYSIYVPNMYIGKFRCILLYWFGVWSIIAFGNILRRLVRSRSIFVEKIICCPIISPAHSMGSHVKIIYKKYVLLNLTYLHTSYHHFTHVPTLSNKTINYNNNNWKVKRHQ